MKEQGTGRGAQGRTRIDNFRQHEVRKSERAKVRTSFTFRSLNKRKTDRDPEMAQCRDGGKRVPRVWVMGKTPEKVPVA